MPTRQPRPALPPEQWSDLDRQRVELLRAVCAPAYEESTKFDGPSLGCRSCATDPSDAKPVAVKAVARKLSDARFGSFSRRDAAEAIVVTSECSPRLDFAEKSPLSDASLLVWSESGWRVARRVEGLGNCNVERIAEGRSGLFCYRWGERQGVEVVDFGLAQPESVLYDFKQNEGLAICNSSQLSSYSVAVLSKQRTEDLDGDGGTDLDQTYRVQTLSPEAGEQLRKLPDFALRCSCSRAFARGQNVIKAGCQCPLLEWSDATPRTLQLHFESSKDGMKPSAATRAVLDEAAQLGL